MSSPRSNTLIAVTLATLPYSFAFAETNANEALLDAITVHARAIEDSAKRATEVELNALNATVAIDAEQLAQYNEQSLGDALRRIPGVTFEDANRARGVRLRGLPDQYTQVLINGRRLLDGNARRTVEVDRIPTALIERIEVIRAPRASMDSQGAAGTINIVLKDGAQLPSQLTIGAGYLQDNGTQGEIGILNGGRVGALDYSLALNVQRFRRSESKDVIEFDENNQTAGATLEENQRRFDQATLAPRLNVAINDNTRLRFEPIYTRTKETRNDIEIPLKKDLRTRGRITDELRLRARKTYGAYSAIEHKLSDNANLLFGIDWQRANVNTKRDEVRLNTDGSLNRKRLRFETIQMTSLHPEAVLSLNYGQHATRLGLEASRQQHDEDNEEIKNGKVSAANAKRIFKIQEKQFVAWAEDAWTVNDRLLLTYGLRHERSATTTTDISGARNKRNANALLPSINLVYALQPATDLRFGLARTLRRPDLRTLSPASESRDGTAADPDRQGNPNQAPESIWGLDLGLYHYFAEQRGQLSLNAFARRFEDKIENTISLQDERFITRPENVGKARAHGLEAVARVPLDSLGLKTLTLWSNAVYSHTRVDQIGGGSHRFLDQPELVANLGLDYQIPAWRTVLGLAINRSSSIHQSQNLANGGRLSSAISARTRLDLSMRSELSKTATLTISLTNLLGETSKRTDRVYDNNGQPSSAERTHEPTYRAIYARLNWKF